MRLRAAIRTVAANPTLAGALLIASVFIAFGCALVLNQAGSEASASKSLAAPSPATQEAILSAQEANLFAVPGWCLPSATSRVPAERRARPRLEPESDEATPLATLLFCPLYRRPPPRTS